MLDTVLDVGNPGWRAGSAPRASLGVGVADESEGGKPLVAFVVVGADALNGFLLGTSDVEADAESHVLSENDVAAGGLGGFVEAGDEAVGEDFSGEGDDALESHPSYVFEGAAAGDGLPDFDGAVEGAGNESDVLKLVAAVGNVGGKVVVFALVAKGLFVEGLEDDLDLLLKKLLVGVVVNDGSAEGLDLPGVVAASNAEDEAAAGHHVGHGEVLGEPEGMPHGDDIESGAKLELAGHAGEVDAEEGEVGEDLVSFALEVVLGGPEAVKAELVHVDRQLLGMAIRTDEMIVGVTAVVCGRAV